jgi:hypothetical protein
LVNLTNLIVAGCYDSYIDYMPISSSYYIAQYVNVGASGSRGPEECICKRYMRLADKNPILIEGMGVLVDYTKNKVSVILVNLERSID